MLLVRNGLRGGGGSALKRKAEGGTLDEKLRTERGGGRTGLKDKADFSGVTAPARTLDREAIASKGGRSKALLEAVEIQNEARGVAQFKNFVSADTSVGFQTQRLVVLGDAK